MTDVNPLDVSQLLDRIELLLLRLGRIAQKRRDAEMTRVLNELWEYFINLKFTVASNRKIADNLVN